jgi:hypothetical protein
MRQFTIRMSLFTAVLVATISSSCGMLAGLAGGMKLSEDGDNGLFMTGNELKSSTLPYQAHPSNNQKKPDDAGLLYGYIPQ